MHRILAAVLLAGSLAAQDLFVDATTGNDTNPGTAAQPVKSITKAVALAGPGSTIHVLSGVYGPATTGEVLPIRIGITGNVQNLTLRGIGSVVLDMNRQGGTAIKVGVNAAGGRITNFTFRNMDPNDWWSKVIEAGSYQGPGSASPFEVDRCVFDGINRGVVIWQNTPPVTGWRVHDNLFLNTTNDAINDFYDLSSNEIYNNTIVGGLHLGMTTDGSTTKVHNNLIVGKRVGIGTGTLQVPGNFRGNDLWNNSIAWQGTVGSAPPGNYAVDPLFVDATNANYRLKPASPLIDAGDPAVWARADLDGVSGAVDSDGNGSVLPDVGAYESTPVAFTATWTGPQPGLLTLQATGPANRLGVMLLALGDGRIQIPGASPILLDPNTILPFVPFGAFPLNFSFPFAGLQKGEKLVLQAFALDPGSGAFQPGRQQWLQW